MSIHGKVGRRLTILEVEFHRSIYEDRIELSPGWVMTFTLPWVDIMFQSFGWKASLWHRLRRWPSWSSIKYGMFPAFGYNLEIYKNFNTPRKYATEDAEPLLYRYRKD